MTSTAHNVIDIERVLARSRWRVERSKLVLDSLGWGGDAVRATNSVDPDADRVANST